MMLHGLLIWGGTRRFANRLHAEKGFDLIDDHFIYFDDLASTLLALRALDLPLVLSARGTVNHNYPAFRMVRLQIV